MFPRFSKWLTGLKAQRDEARAVFSQAAEDTPEDGHGHVHEHFDGVVHEHGHGHGDHEHQHEHGSSSGPDSRA